jgi:hypothetical protein
MRIKSNAIASVLILAAMSAGNVQDALAMNLKHVGNQLILSGPVVGTELDEVLRVLNNPREIDTIILRNSPGGHILTGYRLGELFRAHGFRTAVSGFCFSSCSRMFLGGKERYFTDDYPPQYTHVGFHGHYDNRGDLLVKQVDTLHLKDWIVKYSDGKADPALVDRWIHIPRTIGLIHFYHPGHFKRQGVSTFMCQGDEPMARSAWGCQPIAKTALDLGVVTSLTVLKSNDQAEIRAGIPDMPPPSGYAEIDDLAKVPLIGGDWQEEYRRFLGAWLPKAIAVALDGKFWAWNAGGFDAMTQALSRCSQRSKQACTLYAVDNDVVFVKR